MIPTTPFTVLAIGLISALFMAAMIVVTNYMRLRLRRGFRRSWSPRRSEWVATILSLAIVLLFGGILIWFYEAWAHKSLFQSAWLNAADFFGRFGGMVVGFFVNSKMTERDEARN